MALTAGTRIGPFLVKSSLGEGGMGVVFRALDTKLQREVALKLLPDHFRDDPDRLTRFRREAQVLASLNHPNVAQIYGLEESAIPGQRRRGRRRGLAHHADLQLETQVMSLTTLRLKEAQ